MARKIKRLNFRFDSELLFYLSHRCSIEHKYCLSTPSADILCNIYFTLLSVHSEFSHCLAVPDIDRAFLWLQVYHSRCGSAYRQQNQPGSHHDAQQSDGCGQAVLDGEWN